MRIIYSQKNSKRNVMVLKFMKNCSIFIGHKYLSIREKKIKKKHELAPNDRKISTP
jgi:hypothetical protein